MTIRIATLLISGCLAAASQNVLSQVAEDFPDPSFTREQWQQRIEESRRRSEEFVANARTRASPQLQIEQMDAEAADRAMSDPTLRQGDMVVTSKGLMMFIGRDERHQPGDFISAPTQRPP